MLKEPRNKMEPSFYCLGSSQSSYFMKRRKDLEPDFPGHCKPRDPLLFGGLLCSRVFRLEGTFRDIQTVS